ncbi:MAG: topoisomerase C-terminal repeat-containing protein, partial [Terracidiphilus sp.]
YKLIDALVGTFAFVEYDYTRSLEQQLDDIAQGTAKYIAVVSQLDSQLDKELGNLHVAPRPVFAAKRVSEGSSDAKQTAVRCPRCKQGYLRLIPGKDFYGCDQYRNGCRFVVNQTYSGKKLTHKQIETLCTNGRIGPIKGFKSAKTGRDYQASLVCNENTEWKMKPDYSVKQSLSSNGTNGRK